MRGLTLLVGALLCWPLAAQAAPSDRVSHGDVVVELDETVADVVSFGGSVTVRGQVEGDAVSFGGRVRVEPGGKVHGDITTFGGGVDVMPGAVAFGDRVAVGSEAPETVVAAGPVADSAPHGLGHKISGLIKHITHMIGLYVLLVVLGIVMLGVAPQRTRALAAAVAAFPAKSFGFGLLGAVISVVAIVVLAATVIGIPVAAILAAVVACAACLGLTGVSILVGELLPSEKLKDKQITKLMLGALLLVLALQIPIAGAIVGVVATLVGLGSLIVTRMRPGHQVFTGAGPYRSAPAPQ